MSGFDGATATLPIDRTGCSSKIGAKVVPALPVLNSPPVPVATKNCAGFPGTRAISLIRPPMLAGPTGRQERDRNCSAPTGPVSPAAPLAGLSAEPGFLFVAAALDPRSVGRPVRQAKSSRKVTRAVRGERRADQDMGASGELLERRRIGRAGRMRQLRRSRLTPRAAWIRVRRALPSMKILTRILGAALP